MRYIVASGVLNVLLACHVSPAIDASNAPAPAARADAETNEQYFLMAHGRGSAAETDAYYALIAPEAATGPSGTPILSLDAWVNRWFAAAPVVTSFYQNGREVGAWRDMRCTKSLQRGTGACMSIDYASEADWLGGGPNLGTVAMAVNAGGDTIFFSFSPNGDLSETATLDSEGLKFAPRACSVCHGGRLTAPAKKVAFGSVFREFEVARLTRRSGIDQDQFEAEMFALNAAVRSANEAQRKEAEGAPYGTDSAVAALLAHLDDMYPLGVPPARPMDDPAQIPASWKQVGDVAGQDVQTTLWTTVVNSYCMGCHRVGRARFADFEQFSFLRDPDESGVPLLRQYLSSDPTNHRGFFMPQAEAAFHTLASDVAAQVAIDAWLQ